MLTLHLTLDNGQVTVRANELQSHSFFIRDLDNTDFENFVNDPKLYGGKLFQALFRDGSEARKVFDELSKLTERVIVLVLESSELDGIAWEYAYHDNAYIVEDSAFIRALPEMERPHANGRLSKSVERMPLLFIPANPLVDLRAEPLRELDIESEWREMTQHIIKSNAPFDLIELRPTTPIALQSVMAKFQTGMIAHFSGHGAATKDGAFLLFENENGSSNPLEAREFVREVKDQAWIGFLSACQSAVAEKTAFGNLARELVKAGVPFALGMQFNLPDPFAPNISGQFYNYLSQGHAVPEAARQARRAVKRENEFYVGMIALYAAHPDEAGKMGWTGSGAQTLSTFAAADVSDLPTPSGFIGRQRELMNIGTSLLAKKKPNTVTLHGAGGIGKTALMRQALLRFAPSFELTLAIALDPLPSLESMLGRLERFLNLPSPCSNDTKEREKIVRGKLTGRETLLGLDNFETLNYALNEKDSEEEKTAKSLHSFFKYLAANGVTLCVTSREVTNLGGEVIIDIEGLPNDVGGRLFQDNVVSQKDEIYTEKTQQVSEMVGGHPLALRLLASAFDDQVEKSLDQYIEDLKSYLPKARDKWTEEDRHESLRASFDFTMRNLVKTEEGKELQIVLSRLSVFIAYFPPFLAAPTIACKWPETSEEDQEQQEIAERLLYSLWGRGLLERLNLPLRNKIDYLFRIHPALSHFAATHVSPKDLPIYLGTHWRSMYQLASNAHPSNKQNGIYGNPLISSIVRLAIPDLMKATKLQTDSDPSDFLYNVAFLLEHFGSLNDALDLYQQSCNIKDKIGDLRGKSNVLGDMAYIFRTRGDLDKAINLHEQSLKNWEKLNDLKGKSITLQDLAGIYVLRNDLEAAARLCLESLEINEKLGDLPTKAANLYQMASIYEVRGELNEAAESLSQSLTIFRELGNSKGVSDSLSGLAYISHRLGFLEEASDLYQQSLNIKKEIGDSKGISTVLHETANLYVTKGNFLDALPLYKQALEISESLGDLNAKATALSGIASIYMHNKNFIDAITMLEQSLSIHHELGNQRDESIGLTNIGQAFWASGSYGKALVSLFSGLKLLSQLNIDPGTQNTIASILIGWQQIIGAEKFDELWQEEIGQPIPEWLKQKPHRERGMTAEQFIVGAIQSVREKRPEAEQYFKEAQRMAVASNAPAELQALSKVLLRIMIGEKNVDLSVLPTELREMVEKALAG